MSPSPAPAARARARLVWLLVLGILQLVVAFCWLTAIPPFEGPDELQHYDYARYVAVNGRLPDRPPRSANADGWYTGQWIQEPLYYWTLGQILRTLGPDVANAPLSMHENPHSAFQRNGYQASLLRHDTPLDPPLRRGLLTARLVSTAAGLVLILSTFLALRSVSTDTIAGFATLCLLLIPEFGVRFAVAANDLVAAALASVAAMLALGLDTTRHRWTRSLATGAFAGLAVAVKLTAGIAIPIAFLALWFQRRPPRAIWWRHVAACAAGVTLAAAWVFIRNWLLFGDPLAAPMKLIVLQQVAARQTVDAMNVSSLLTLTDYLFRSFWAAAGWTAVGPRAAWPWTVYGVISTACALLMLIALLPARRRTGQEEDADVQRRTRAAVWMSAVAVLLQTSGIVFALSQYAGGRTARYLLPVIVPLLVLVVRGAMRLADVGRLNGTLRMAAAGLVLAVLLVAWLETYSDIARAFGSGRNREAGWMGAWRGASIDAGQRPLSSAATPAPLLALDAS